MVCMLKIVKCGDRICLVFVFFIFNCFCVLVNWQFSAYDGSCCSSYGVANTFSFISPFSNTSTWIPILISMVVCKIPYLYLSGSEHNRDII